MDDQLAETCLVCDKAIGPGEPRYRPPAGSFHVTCYEAMRSAQLPLQSRSQS